MLDSEERNALHFLASNKKLKRTEKNEILNILYSLGTPMFSASFDCKKANTKIELQTCSRAENA